MANNELISKVTKDMREDICWLSGIVRATDVEVAEYAVASLHQNKYTYTLECIGEHPSLYRLEMTYKYMLTLVSNIAQNSEEFNVQQLLGMVTTLASFVSSDVATNVVSSIEPIAPKCSCGDRMIRTGPVDFECPNCL